MNELFQQVGYFVTSLQLQRKSLKKLIKFDKLNVNFCFQTYKAILKLESRHKIKSRFLNYFLYIIWK